MTGTPSRITKSFVSDVADRVRLGAQPQATIIALGVPQRTASRWLAIGRGEQLPEGGEEPGEQYVALWEAIEEAQAEARSGAETAILANKDFRAQQAWLGAKFPAEWNPKYQTPDAQSGLTEVFARLAALGTKAEPLPIEGGDGEIVELESVTVEAESGRV